MWVTLTTSEASYKAWWDTSSSTAPTQNGYQRGGTTNDEWVDLTPSTPDNTIWIFPSLDPRELSAIVEGHRPIGRLHRAGTERARCVLAQHRRPHWKPVLYARSTLEKFHRKGY